MELLAPGQLVGVLGKSSDLSWGELQALLPDAKRLNSYLALLPATISNPSDVNVRFGGLVKVLQVVSVVEPDESKAARAIAADVARSRGRQLAFTSQVTQFSLKNVANEVKQIRKEDGESMRFRLLDSLYESAGITRDWVEYVILTLEHQVHVFKTVSVQDISNWSKKDYGRPKFDARSGMMPPKLARILVNLAMPAWQPDRMMRFYDPFCGSGTLLVEALDIGWSVVGTDLSAQAVADSVENTKWFIDQAGIETSPIIKLADATHVTVTELDGLVDGIAFEGYLGPPHPQPAQFKNLIKGLSKLYKGVFKRMQPLLKDDGFLVCALPEYRFERQVWNLDRLIDEIEALGYTQIGRFVYARPQAVVARKIYVLKKLSV